MKINRLGEILKNSKNYNKSWPPVKENMSYGSLSSNDTKLNPTGNSISDPKSEPVNTGSMQRSYLSPPGQLMELELDDPFMPDIGGIGMGGMFGGDDDQEGSGKRPTGRLTDPGSDDVPHGWYQLKKGGGSSNTDHLDGGAGLGGGISENINPRQLNITIDDFEKIISKSKNFRDNLSLLKVIVDFYYSDDPKKKKDAEDYIQFLNKVGIRYLSIAEQLHLPHIDINSIKAYFLGQTEFSNKEEDFFPFPLYVSASPQDEATIGIMVNEQGKVTEIHEGNDEATPETIQLVNRLVNPNGKPVRIYGSHAIRLVQKIEETGYLPPNLYVSSYKPHALAYQGIEGDRLSFTGIVNVNSLNQESDLDWKTIETTKIDKFRLV